MKWDFHFSNPNLTCSTTHKHAMLTLFSMLTLLFFMYFIHLYILNNKLMLIVDNTVILYLIFICNFPYIQNQLIYETVNSSWLTILYINLLVLYEAKAG